MSQEITKFYRNTAIIFVGISVLLAGGIFYFNLARAVVTITSSAAKTTAEFIVDIKEFPFEPKEFGENELNGRIFEVIKEESRIFSASDTKKVESDSVGRVTIINNYSKEQVLIATTRLLAPNGVLLRTKNDVVVPAGQQVAIEVYADNPEEFTELEPTKFTIPGLWPGLQDKIYGQSQSKFYKGGFDLLVVSQNDIDLAKTKMRESLYQQALMDIENELTTSEKLYTKVVKQEVIEEETDAEPGQERDTFAYRLKLKTIIVAFDEKKLINLVEKRLENDIQEGKKLISLDTNSLTYNLEKYDMGAKAANLKVKAAGISSLTEDTHLFSSRHLVNMSEQEVEDYFNDFEEIEKVEIQFIPAWFKKMPRSANRIEIQIK